MLGARAIKNKSGPTVSAAVREIFLEMNPPQFLQVGFFLTIFFPLLYPFLLKTDKGLEFRNESFKKVLTEFDVHHYFAKNINKAAVAERVIKTLKTRIFRYLHSKDTKRYVDRLQEMVKAYNNSYHSCVPTSSLFFALSLSFFQVYRNRTQRGQFFKRRRNFRSPLR